LTRALAFTVALAACSAELPVIVRDEMAATSRLKPGAATIVFFTDFQCPHCRRTHAALEPLVRGRESAVRVVLKHVPLDRHPDARTAARAAICVEIVSPPVAQDYAHALFTTQDLSAGSCEELAATRGVDMDRWHACLASVAPDARIARDLAAYESVGGSGVPLLFIGKERIDGAPPPAMLAAALDDALPHR
jgi:protein-disulfide isomerase